jgi:hypothetical protein
MIQVDLPDGPASPLVRGLAACLSSATEVPLDELPMVDDMPMTQALASWKSWLAGRGFGIVPIADPGAFQWAGWWIAVVDRSDSVLADGPHRQVAVLAFGTPPGVVLTRRTRRCWDVPQQTSTSTAPTPSPRSTPYCPRHTSAPLIAADVVEE